MDGLKFKTGDIVKVGGQVETVTQITESMIRPYMVGNLITKVEFPFSDSGMRPATQEEIDEFRSRSRPKYKVGDKVVVKALDAVNKNGEVTSASAGSNPFINNGEIIISYIVKLEHNGFTYSYGEDGSQRSRGMIR
jgi:hypothetical protein